jgi:lipopolysaccharide transport system ATP-binding protein
MSNFAIKVEKLGKKYRIGAKQQPYQTLRESLVQVASSPFRKVRDLLSGQAYGASNLSEDFWALKDVSFEIKHGDVVGIIGRNGAGKSTLLKILSRITEPSLGYVDIYGRVGALLEVGTGFHPELTGRENVYLNGTILGMTRKEIDHKFDAIVDFAGVEKFIDTPVKHYSSGMGLRLGFAIAAFLEPEILIVDEVLAVGDAEFQKKCLGKMQDVAGEGRTVLFVSHNMSAILDLCQHVFWVNQGGIYRSGKSIEIVQEYLSEGNRHTEIDLTTHRGRRKESQALLQAIRLKAADNSSAIMMHGTLEFEVDFNAESQILPRMSLGFLIKDAFGHTIFATSMAQYEKIISNNKQHYTLRVTINDLPLSPGTFNISLYLGSGTYDLDVIENALYFDVIWNDALNLAFPSKASWGTIHFPVHWEVI